MNEVAELWGPVRRYEGLYEASNMGQVRSLERFVRGRDGSARRLLGQVLTPRIRPDGTHAVNLWKNNKYKQVPIRRVVMETFDRPKPNGMDAINVNGNPADNRLSNLKWQIDRRMRNTDSLGRRMR